MRGQRPCEHREFGLGHVGAIDQWNALHNEALRRAVADGLEQGFERIASRIGVADRTGENQRNTRAARRYFSLHSHATSLHAMSNISDITDATLIAWSAAARRGGRRKLRQSFSKITSTQ
jgi:hypothetical protein